MAEFDFFGFNIPVIDDTSDIPYRAMRLSSGYGRYSKVYLDATRIPLGSWDFIREILNDVPELTELWF